MALPRTSYRLRHTMKATIHRSTGRAAVGIFLIIGTSMLNLLYGFVPSQLLQREQWPQVFPLPTRLGTNHYDGSFSCRRAFATDESTSNDQEMLEMRADIQRMREEALKRLAVLNQKFHDVEAKTRDELLNPVLFESEYGADPRVQELVAMAESFDREMEQQQQPVSTKSSDDIGDVLSAEATADAVVVSTDGTGTTASTSIAASTEKSHPLKLLDGTRWRLMLNVGREPGTWMPKTWGVSGDRLYLNLELEFTPEQLYERDDFFNGVSGSKVLHVVHNEGSLAPNMMEGGRRIRVGDGGWRVVPNEGPLGTAVLRFYFDLEEEAKHQGSDVNLPIGRVYCTCGYFPMAERSGANGGDSTKAILEKEQQQLEAHYRGLYNKNELDDSIFSLDKLKRAKEMMDIRGEIRSVGKAIQEARVREPERSLLRLSQDQSVGLTREGGVCCKKQKGVSVEYHILGHFEIASMENREHGDYRELLP